MMELWRVSLLLSLLLPSSCHGVTVEAEVERDGVSGSVRFDQRDPGSEVTVSANLTGLDDFVSLTIHSLPFPPSSPSPCQLVGPPFRELGSVQLSQTTNYSNISLYGNESIVGRSLVINSIMCVNIRPPKTIIPLLLAPFRSNNITNGNVFLWQQTIYISLTTSAPSLPWAILSPSSDCIIAPGNIYNPDMVGGACNPGDGAGCAVGDLSGRMGDLSVEGGAVEGGAVELILTDPALSEGLEEGLQLAVGSECAPISLLPPLTATTEGVLLTQQSPLDLTEVRLPQGKRYQIHTSHDCQWTGGIFDPRGAGSAPFGPTLDSFPFGDLSGKAGSSLQYSDPYLPLSGPDSVVGRTLVVMETDGTVSGCGLLRYDDEIIEMRVELEMEGFTGVILFTQAAGSPLSDTIITIDTDISAEFELFSPSPSVSSLTPSPLTPSLTPAVTPSLTPAVTPSLTPPLPPSLTELPMESSLPPLLIPFETSSILPTPPPSSLPLLLLLPDSSPTATPTATPTVTPPGGSQERRRRRRKREVAEYNWSLRQWNSDTEPQNCAQLPMIGWSGAGCSASSPLACAVGDLTAKHGLLPSGPHSTILHDPHLPINSVTDAVLFLEPANGIGDTACVLVTMVTSEATPTPTPLLSTVQPLTSSLPVSPTSPPETNSGTDDDIIIIGAVIGGVVCAGVLVTLLVLCVRLCVRRLRSGRVDLSKRDKKNGRGDVELGKVQLHQKPQIGSDQYRVLCSYLPQSSDSGDLALEEGEWVTLLEAPLGGQWWRGQASAGEGWFPKSHVQFVDREAERRKAEEENFSLAAAAIKAASNSFNERHLSMTRGKATPTRTRAATTLSKADINSTPALTAKFDVTLLDSVVIENQRHLSGSSGGSRPLTPREGEPLTNHVSNETSQESSGSSELAVVLEAFLAKYNFTGGTEIELELRKGELVSVLEKTESGWWQGVSGGRVGWFPASYVKPAPAREKKVEGGKVEGEKVEGERGKKAEGGKEAEAEGGRGNDGETRRYGLPDNLKSEMVDATEYHAIHTFSSGSEGDLQFSEGDVVLVYWTHDNGWWYGFCSGRHGWFPGNYVELSMSEAGSPLPLSPPGQETPPPPGEAAAVTRGSPSRQSWRKRLSFKRSKSQEELLEGGLAPLLPAGDAVRDKNQTKPRRKAPPPPAQTTSPKPAEQPEATSPLSVDPAPSKTTPTAVETTPTPNEGARQKRPVPTKRQKSLSALDPSKPRRLPPAPPTSQTMPQTPPTKSAQPPPIAESAAGSLAPPPAAGATPTAPPRRRKIKRVKRPETRFIPPPPSIPLPPPPPSHTSHRAQNTPPMTSSSTQPTPAERQNHEAPSAPLSAVSSSVERETAQETADDQVTAEKVDPTTKTVGGGGSDGGSDGGGGGSDGGDGGGGGEREVLKSPVKSKPPPIKPKPAHLTKKVSESHLRSPPPAQGPPRPPPPARTSSLHLRNRHRVSANPPPREEVDSPDTAEAVRNLRSAPPTHPPPPRPASAGAESSKPRLDPPSFPPPERPSEGVPSPQRASERPSEGERESASRSNSLKRRGSHLMRSLKKMVQRSESRDEGEESEQRSPVRGQRSMEGEVIRNKEAESPQPEKRQSTGLPVRPPPPQLVNQERGKVTPARPPPPRISSTSLSSSMTTKQDADSDHAHNHTHSSPPMSAGSSPVHSAGSRSMSPQPPSTFYRVRSEYKGRGSGELTLRVGDILVELDRPSSSDMYYGMLDDGTTGLFPPSAVEPIPTPSSKK